MDTEEVQEDAIQSEINESFGALSLDDQDDISTSDVQEETGPPVEARNESRDYGENSDESSPVSLLLCRNKPVQMKSIFHGREIRAWRGARRRSVAETATPTRPSRS